MNSSPVEKDVHIAEKSASSFADDVLEGLSKSKKTLPSKYFYDEIGDQLFVDIMNLPEYYLTRAEMEIFTTQSEAILRAFNQPKQEAFHVVELGAGDGSKTAHLLAELLSEGYNFDYWPIDISQNALDGLDTSLVTSLPGLRVETFQGEYFKILHRLHDVPGRKVILFLGSNLGNMSDEVAARFMLELSETMDSGDQLLLGLDRIKSAEIVVPAYNDAQGVTAHFNLNLLNRINNELGANFDVATFQHEVEYSEEEGIVRSYLKSTSQQMVHIAELQSTFSFEKGERIHTEISRKYNLEILSKIIRESGLHQKRCFTDSQGFFWDVILEKE